VEKRRTLKRLWVILTGIVAVYLISTALVPILIDRMLNSSTERPHFSFSQEALDLFESLDFIANLHCVALLWKQNLLKKSDQAM
jgi:membrane dipeptidase